MNILITGATGFLGGHLIDALISNKKYTIYASGRNKSKMNKKEGLQWLICDISKEQDLENIFSKVYDIVIHCGAHTNTEGTYEEFYNSNYLGTKNIVDILKGDKHKDTKLIYISTPSIYNKNFNQINISESSSIDVNYIKNSHYVWTKYLAEKYISSTLNSNTIIIRPRAIIGVGDNAIWPNLMRANKKISIPLFRQGNVMLSYTNIDSLTNFIKNLIENENFTSNDYNVSDGFLKMKNIVEILQKYSDFPIKTKKLYFKPLQIVLKTIKLFLPKGKSLSINEESLALLYYDMSFDIDKAKKNNYEIIGTFEEIVKNNFKHWDNQEERWKL